MIAHIDKQVIVSLLFKKYFLPIIFLLFIFLLFPQPVFAETTPFRSARNISVNSPIIGMDQIFFTNLENCSSTDGQTCDRSLGTGASQLYFKDFGTYAEFGIPEGSKITQVQIRVTTRSTHGLGLSIAAGPQDCRINYLNSNWGVFSSQTIYTRTVFSPLVDYYQPEGVIEFCFQPSLFNTNQVVFSLGSSNSQSWSANVDNFEIAFDYELPVVIPAGKTPVILIPGIGGSELKVNEDTYWLNKDDGHGGTFNRIYPKDDIIWLNEPEMRAIGEDDYFDVLRMKDNGVTSEANIGLTGQLVLRVYQSTIDFFISNGYELNKDLFVFPYDWRKDITLTKAELDTKITQIKNQTGHAKVDIVAHSMGGLVARNYIADATKAQNVRKLFTLGTPHLGAPESLKNLRYGGCLKLPFGPFCLSLAPSEMKDVLSNAISGYQLAPSQAYFTFYSGIDSKHLFPYKTEAGVRNYSQIKNLLTSYGHNTSLFSPAENFHTLDNSLPNTNGVDVTVIAGSGQGTVGQIIEAKTTNLFGTQETHKDIRIINGDETVPLFSASLEDPSQNKSLLGSAKVYYTKQNHGELVADGGALQLVKNILEENNQLPNGVSTTAYPLFDLWSFSVHSPVTIDVYDVNGNHTGLTENGDFEANIPGSRYDTLGDAKFVFVPQNGQFTIKFKATDQGSFDFKIKKYDNNEITKAVLYKDIPLTNQTKAQTSFNTNDSQTPIINVDKDGNGTTDATVISSSTLTGSTLLDQTAPQTEIQLSGTKGLGGWYKSNVLITLKAKDEASGSGILKTQYTLDNGQTIKTYIGPIAITEEKIHTVKFMSIDKAGNEEDAKELIINIDKTAPEAKVYIDQDKQDLVVMGIDKNPTTVVRTNNMITRKKDDGIYTITDVAGNTLKLDVRERYGEKKDRFTIYSMQYNNNSLQILPQNHFIVTYEGKKERLNVKNQSFELKGNIILCLQYDKKKNKTTVIIKELGKDKVKEVKNGLVTLQLITNKGQLQTSY